MVDFEQKDKYSVADLLRIMEILRAPDGCMWDRAQDHHSIRQNFIEDVPANIFEEKNLEGRLGE